MAPRCSWDRLLHRALQVRFLRRLAVQLAHGRARLQSVLAVDHDLLVSLQAGIDQRLPVTDLRYRDQAHLHFFVGPDDPDIRALRALLHGRGRDRQAVVPRIQEKPGVDEFTRPQLAFRVGEARPQPDGAGGLNDLIVDEVEPAFIQLDPVVLAVGQHRELSLGDLLLDLDEVGLGQREYQGDRLDLRDIDQPIGVGRMNDVALVDLTDAGDAVDGRGQARVAQ